MADTVSVLEDHADQFNGGQVEQSEPHPNEAALESQQKNRDENEESSDSGSGGESGDDTASDSDSSSESDCSDNDSGDESNSESVHKATKRARSHKGVIAETVSIVDAGNMDKERPSRPSTSKIITADDSASVTSSSSKYTRFDPLRNLKPKTTISSELMQVLTTYFKTYIPNTVLQDKILETAPIPEAEVLAVPETDSIVFSIIEELNKSAEKDVEKGLMTAQNRITNTMGPLYKIWTIMESIKQQSENSNGARIDSFDLWQILDLIEKAMCCVGQAHLSLTYHRRVSHLTKITGDVKEARKVLKDSAEKLTKNDKLLFGHSFKKNLVKLGKEAEQVSKIVAALKKRKRKRKNGDRKQDGYAHKKPRPAQDNQTWNYSRTQGRSQPFQRPHSSGDRLGCGGKPHRGKPKFSKNYRYVQTTKNNLGKSLSQLPSDTSSKDQPFRNTNRGSKSDYSPSNSKIQSNRTSISIKIGRTIKILPLKLGKTYERSIHHSDGKRHQTRIHRESISTPCPTNSQILKRRISAVKHRNSGTNNERGCGSDFSISNTVSEQHILSPKKGRGESTSNKSETLKQIHTIPSFQDGRGSYDKGPSKSKRLHVQARSKRCLPMSTDTCQSSPLSSIQMEQSISKVPFPSVRTGIRPSVLHKANETYRRSIKKDRGQVNHLPGRHAINGPMSKHSHLTQGYHSVPSSSPRSGNQLQQIPTRTNSANRVFRVRNRFYTNDVQSTPGKNSGNSRPVQRDVKNDKRPSTSLSKINRQNGLDSTGSATSHTPVSSITNDTDKNAPSRQDIRRQGRSITRGQTRLALVDRPTKLLQWKSYYSSISRLCHRVGCVQKRVGGCVWRHTNRRFMGIHRTGSPHKSSRTPCSLSRSQMFYKNSKQNSRPSKTGQHDSSSSFTKNGGHKISGPQSADKRNLGVVQTARNILVCGTHPRFKQLPSRLRIQTFTRFKRLAVKKGHIHQNTRKNGNMYHRSLCFSSKPPTDTFRQLETGPRSMENGCLSDNLGQSECLRISSIFSDRQVPGQGQTGRSNININSSCLAGTALVPSTGGNVDTNSTTASNHSGLADLPRRGVASISGQGGSTPNSLENFGGPPEAGTLSKKSAELHAGAWRPGTRASYKSAWGKWASWCAQRNFNPIQSPVETVVEFLTSLFEQGLQYRTINTYRSSISRGHELVEGVPIGQNRIIVTHMRAIFNLRTPKPRYDSIWDVNVVLNCILSWGNTITLNIRDLTLKLCMLLALTSAGRCSELQALDTKFMKHDPEYVKFELPVLSKTSKPNQRNKTITFNKFISNPGLCVVTILNYYLKQTASWREKESTLLLSYVKPHKAVTSSTVSRWLKTVIQRAGINSDIFKGHSTRAASTSKAFGAGLSVKDIMNRAGWSKPSTFKTFYCRDTIQTDLFQQSVLTRR